MSHPTLQSFFPHELLSFCSFKGGLLLQDSGGNCIRPKGPILLWCEWLKVGMPCGDQRSDSLSTDLHVTSMEPSNNSRGKRECPFRYWLSHLVTQRSQWQSEFEGESWIVCTCTHTSMMEFRASGTLGKLTYLYIYISNIYFLNRVWLSYSGWLWTCRTPNLAFQVAVITCLHAWDWFVIFLFP